MDTPNTVTGHDVAVESIIKAARSCKGTATDRWQAIIRAGEIAKAYFGQPELVEKLFSSAPRSRRT